MPETNSPPTTGKSEERQRVFIALALPDKIRECFLKVAGDLRKGAQYTPCQLKWVQPEGLHLTLHFLGGRSQAEIDAVRRAMDGLAGRAAAPFLEIKQFGVFPHWRSPRVLWAGVRDRGKRLAALHEQLKLDLIPIGYRPETREFSAHLTLARFKSMRGVAALEKTVKGQPAYKIGPFEAPECILYRSRLLPEGAQYEALHRIVLTPPSGDGEV